MISMFIDAYSRSPAAAAISPKIPSIRSSDFVARGLLFSKKKSPPRVHFRGGYVKGKGLTASSFDLLPRCVKLPECG